MMAALADPTAGRPGVRVPHGAGLPVKSLTGREIPEESSDVKGRAQPPHPATAGSTRRAVRRQKRILRSGSGPDRAPRAPAAP